MVLLLLEAIKKAIAERPSWDELFFTQAMTASLRSIDTSSQLGAVVTTKDNVLVAQGYNGPPRGMDIHDERVQIELVTRPNKYRYFEHAERNAIFNALRTGAHLHGSILYTNGFPCSDCARAIVQVGISKIKVLKSTNKLWSNSPDWDHPIDKDILIRGGVEIEECDVKLIYPHKIRFSGREHVIE